MDGIPLLEIRSCIDLGLLGSRRSFLAVVGLIQLVTDTASLLFKGFHIYTAGFRQFIHSTDGMIGIILGILKNVLGFFIGFVENPFLLFGNVVMLFFQTFLQGFHLSFVSG